MVMLLAEATRWGREIISRLGVLLSHCVLKRLNRFGDLATGIKIALIQYEVEAVQISLVCDLFVGLVDLAC